MLRQVTGRGDLAVVGEREGLTGTGWLAWSVVAQKYVVQVIDDLDGVELDSDDVEEVRFGLDGTAYVIDLSRTNAATLRGALSRYTDAARREQTATRAVASTSRGGGAQKRKDLDEVRAWANSHGYTVSSRGRVPGEVLQAYDAR